MKSNESFCAELVSFIFSKITDNRNAVEGSYVNVKKLL